MSEPLVVEVPPVKYTRYPDSQSGEQCQKHGRPALYLVILSLPGAAERGQQGFGFRACEECGSEPSLRTNLEHFVAGNWTLKKNGQTAMQGQMRP